MITHLLVTALFASATARLMPEPINDTEKTSTAATTDTEQPATIPSLGDL